MIIVFRRLFCPWRESNCKFTTKFISCVWAFMIEVLSGYIHQEYSLFLSILYVLALVHFQRKLRTNSVLCNYFVSRIQTSGLLLSLQMPRISFIKRTYKTIFAFIHFIKHATVFLYRLNSRWVMFRSLVFSFFIFYIKGQDI